MHQLSGSMQGSQSPSESIIQSVSRTEGSMRLLAYRSRIRVPTSQVVPATCRIMAKVKGSMRSMLPLLMLPWYDFLLFKPWITIMCWRGTDLSMASGITHL